MEGKSLAQVACDLGLAEQTVSNWRKVAKSDKLAIGKPVTLEQMEMSRLKAENARLKVEILKSDGVLRCLTISKCFTIGGAVTPR